ARRLPDAHDGRRSVDVHEALENALPPAAQHAVGPAAGQAQRPSGSYLSPHRHHRERALYAPRATGRRSAPDGAQRGGEVGGACG
ncbi:MAG: hypothetical protein QOJ82_1628, partial [Solirubrobacteraceae bacterium]|nr:hypothetical protein [Solirubrobacteraceae bacterium]